ncbi:MAG: tripartite tricarboxylate transporter substrate binding protein, partial [Proteobacteria bacterium]|nr:tripartite tricarboxylate transporter substrate binding protein [Pseudomonadota bacterium]
MRFVTGYASLAAVTLLFAAANACAQSYPSKQLRFVVPFPPGGPADILSRTIGQSLAESWAQQVVIDNRAGAGGNIGAEIVAKAPPDGYTMLMGFVGTHAINSSLYRSMPFDAVKDFEPVALVAMVTIILVVHPSVPVKTVKELIALANAKPGELSFGSPGNGTPQHLAGELFNTMTGVKMVHVPYKGAVPALTDLLGGRLSMIFSSMPPALPHLQSGKLRALGVTSSARSPAAPDVPTIAQSGLKGYEVINWYGVLVPAKTPKEIVGKLNGEVVGIMNLPAVKERLAAQGAETYT